MKFFLIPLTILLLLSISACKKNTQSSIIGTWQIDYIDDSLFTFSNKNFISDTTYSGSANDSVTFSPSGQMTVNTSIPSANLITNSNFQIVGSKIALTSPPIDTLYIKKITQNELIFTNQRFYLSPATTVFLWYHLSR
jgi:hypothetical protein